MKLSVEKLPTSEAVLDIELSWDELEKASDKVYRKLVQKVDVQGFRRGKAPRSLLERKLGKEYIYKEGLDELITEAYRNAVKEHELTPITQPELDAPLFEIGQPYHVSLKVPILTPVVLGDYRSLHVEREEAVVTSEEVEQRLESLRVQRGKWQPVERPAALLDLVTMDLKLTSGEQTLADLKDNPFELTEQRHGLYIGADEHIVGMQVGESKTFTTILPADYGNEKLAGQEVHYEATLHKVEAKELPELDDEFAKGVDDHETLEDLRKDISDKIFQDKKQRINNELRSNVIGAVTEQAQVTVHPLLIEEEAETMLHQLSHMLEQNHIPIDQYLMMMRKTREEFLKEAQPEAEEGVKRQLVLDAVAKKEEITISADELEAFVRAYAQTGQAIGRSEEQLRSLALAFSREKTVTRLIELLAGPDPDAENVQGPIESEAEGESSEDIISLTPSLVVAHGDDTAQTETAKPSNEIVDSDEAKAVEDAAQSETVESPNETADSDEAKAVEVEATYSE